MTTLPGKNNCQLAEYNQVLNFKKKSYYAHQCKLTESFQARFTRHKVIYNALH